MTESTQSYLKVQYDLRPAKQVERRMLIDAFQSLGLAGFQICDYQYTGFGSPHFVDFVLFHKFLGIKKMLSVEHDKRIKKRVYFNRPYKDVDIKIMSVGDIIPTLSKDRKHLLWLDYDDLINAEMLRDIALAANCLSAGSILLATLDGEPPGLKTEENPGPKKWKKYYHSVAEQYIGSFTDIKDFVESNLKKVNVYILDNAIKAGLASRPDVFFYPLFNFSYADGHEMITYGGMIGTKIEEGMINSSTLKDKSYSRFDLSDPPFTIRVPKVTRKERLYLDSNMPCRKNWRPKEFEFLKDEIKAYREIYRYFPAYAEMML